MTDLLTLPERPAATLPTGIACAGCGYVAPTDALLLRCPKAVATDDIDHVLRRTLDTAHVAWPGGSEANPFVRYRTLFHGYQRAVASGRSDAEVVAEIEALDRAVAAVDGRGFTVTPLVKATFEGVTTLVKDETRNVSGSHKARHLFGTLLELRLAGADDPRRPLAIASCGNAALAAAVVARAAQRELLVFVPADADPAVLERLAQLGARLTICERREGERGDPTVLRMREALASGAIPFTCQGNENGLAIEGGLTLGYELADQWRALGIRVDHLFIQVGGGALASSVIQALEEAKALGVLEALPRIQAVQTTNTHPLARAYDLVRTRLDQRLAAHLDRASQTMRGAIANGLAVEEMAWVARHRSDFMKPWESVPHSIASGILDDETYDWLAVVHGMLASGGRAVLVDEATLAQANQIARAATGIDVDHTGSAGLAGLIELRRHGAIGAGETCAVLFTGVTRTTKPRPATLGGFL
jgi:threonine synthase